MYGLNTCTVMPYDLDQPNQGEQNVVEKTKPNGCPDGTTTAVGGMLCWGALSSVFPMPLTLARAASLVCELTEASRMRNVFDSVPEM